MWRYWRWRPRRRRAGCASDPAFEAASENRSTREQAADHHRRAGAELFVQAEEAEQQARIAQQQAATQRAEAERREELAERHDQGLADQELIADDERERFRGTSAVPDAAAIRLSAKAIWPRTTGNQPRAKAIWPRTTGNQPRAKPGRQTETR